MASERAQINRRLASNLIINIKKAVRKRGERNLHTHQLQEGTYFISE